MAASFTGVTASELDETKRFNPRTGDVRIRHWQGSPLEIATIETQAKNLKYSFSTGWNGGYKTISVEYPESEENDPTTPLSEDWECTANYLQKDIWSLPRVQTELAKIGASAPNADMRAMIRATFRHDFDLIANGREVTIQRLSPATGLPIDGEETTVTLAILLDMAQRIYGADIEVFRELADDISKGVSTWEIEQYVVRHTQITNRSSEIVAARANVRKIHAASYINSRLPEDVKFEAPDTGYWLKRIPDVSRIEKGKWEIMQEWWHADSYSTLIYPDAPIA